MIPLTVKKLFNLLRALLLMLLLLFAFLNMQAFVRNKLFDIPLPRMFGFYSTEILTGSMQPELNAYDLIIGKHQKVYHPGDVITFYDKPLKAVI